MRRNEKKGLLYSGKFSMVKNFAEPNRHAQTTPILVDVPRLTCNSNIFFVEAGHSMRITCTHRKFPAIQYMIEAIPQVGLHLALSVYMGEDTISKSVQVYYETESSTYRTEGRMWVATLWDKKDVGIL